MLGERLRAARLAKGWTQEALGQAVGGLTKAAISAYERDHRTPDAQTLRKLAGVLDLPSPGWLLQTPLRPVEWLGFRKSSRLSAGLQRQIQAKAERTVDAFLELRELVDPQRPVDFPQPVEVLSLDGVEGAADALRLTWGCGDGPLPSLTALVEEHGAVVLGIRPDSQFDGLSGVVDTAKGRVPVAVLNDTVSPDRFRLSLAHELGHRLLRVAPGQIGGRRPDETAAFRFGAALLVPAATARQELGPRRTRLPLGELVELKQRYGLSISGWTRRARDLSIITESEYARWQKVLKTTGLYRTEATEYPYCGDEQPSRLQQMLAHALAEGLVSETWARQWLPDVLDALAHQVDRVLSESPARRLRKASRDERAQVLRAAAKAAAESGSNEETHVFRSVEGEPFDE